MARVLVTGSAGAVGQPVCVELIARGHFVRGFDRVSTPNGAESVQGDITNVQALSEAIRSMDCVIHLAATTDDADFSTELLPNNIVAVHSLMESARQHKIKRVILASSGQVVSGVPRVEDRPVRLADGVGPKNMYAVTKIFAETIGQMYSLQYGISTIAIRLGWLPRRSEDLQNPAGKPWMSRVYLSQRDCGRLFAQAVEAQNVPYAVVFGTSRTDHPHMDQEPARRLLGFEPQDEYPDGLLFPVPDHVRKK